MRHAADAPMAEDDPSGIATRPARILALSILLVALAGSLHALLMPGMAPAPALHPLSAAGYAAFAVQLLAGAGHGARTRLWAVPSVLFLLVSAQRVMEAALPGWFELLRAPVFLEVKAQLGVPGSFTVETALALLTLHLSLLAERIDRRAAMLCLGAVWASTTMNLLANLFDVVFWESRLSAFSLICMLIAAAAQTHRLRDATFVRPVFSRESYGCYTRLLIAGSMLVPWLAGAVYFRHAPLMDPDHKLLELVFGFIGWVFLALVLVIGHLMEGSRRRLDQAALHDALTGAMNRHGLREALRGQSGHLGVILFDLDHFKAVNDTFGHDAGDRALHQTAQRVAASLRQTDMFARWGGEEFLIVATAPDEAQLGRTAERLRRIIAAQPPVTSGTLRIPVTASFGVSMLAPGEQTIEAAVKRADQALYAAKRQGRNRVIPASAVLDGTPEAAPQPEGTFPAALSRGSSAA